MLNANGDWPKFPASRDIAFLMNAAWANLRTSKAIKIPKKELLAIHQHSSLLGIAKRLHEHRFELIVLYPREVGKHDGISRIR
jgi:hypothetical protein